MEAEGKLFALPWLQKPLDWLLRPHARLTNAEDRQQSRLLSALLLVLMISGGAIIAAVVSLDPTDLQAPAVQGAFVILGISAVMYVLSRLGYPQIGAAGLIITFTVVFFYATYLTGSEDPSPTNSMFLLVPIILSGIFFKIRWATVMAVVVIAGTYIFNNQVPQDNPAFWQYRSLWYVIVLVSVLLVTFIWHLSILEGIRRAELETANRQLRESEIRLEQRVEERTRELSQALEKAEESDRVKSQFMASMSHELRTPLNAILNFSQIMAMGALGPLTERQTDTLQEVVSSGKHLLSLINDVLDMSKIQGGMLNLFLEDNVNLNDLLNNAASTAGTLIGSKPVRLVRDIDDGLPLALCDQRRIQQVLLNLLSNAAKFTPSGTITLSAKHVGDEVLFAVIDTGPGIRPEDREIIFEPFLQTETGIQHIAGTGLGLPISRSLAEAHGGKLWLETDRESGAAFMFTLPVASDALRRKLDEQIGETVDA